MRIRLTLGLFLIFVTSAFGQDFPKAEIFGGYSYSNYRVLGQRSALNGWDASATVNIYKWFGLTADFGGAYGGSATETTTAHLGTSVLNQTIHETLDSYTFMFGPQFSYRKSRLTPFTHFLIGKARLGETLNVGFSGCANACGTTSSTSLVASAAAVALGGGADYRIARKIAWRVQADYLELGAANDVRVSTGLVFRLGK